MVVLSRKLGEKVVIDNGITLTVVEVGGSRVQMAFDAPEQVRIFRAEVAGWEEDLANRGCPAEHSFVCEW